MLKEIYGFNSINVNKILKGSVIVDSLLKINYINDSIRIQDLMKNIKAAILENKNDENIPAIEMESFVFINLYGNLRINFLLILILT
jgi:hypothetical protein